MKKILFVILTTISLTAYGQDKSDYIRFNKLTEVVGTEYVIASVENLGKMLEIKKEYLLFVNTQTGETNQVDFPKDTKNIQIEQIKIDSLGINVIVVSARTFDLNEKFGIDWDDPQQIIVLSSDGNEKTQLTDNEFFVRTWKVNKLSGTIVITGHYDTNNNRKYDKTDKSEIQIYDLKTLKLIYKI